MINRALETAADKNQIVIFPAGIYVVDDTITIPVNSRIVGALWSQIMAYGPRFSDLNQTKVLAK